LEAAKKVINTIDSGLALNKLDEIREVSNKL
jgi:hypothetical protein